VADPYASSDSYGAGIKLCLSRLQETAAITQEILNHSLAAQKLKATAHTGSINYFQGSALGQSLPK
jgi:hypothetical protein